MRHKLVFNLASVISSGFCIALLLSSVYGQAGESEKSKIKDFGWSLKHNAKRKDDKAENKKEKTGKADDEEIVRVETALVVTDILVLNKQGRSITGLKKEDFLVSEDSKQQEIGMFSLGENGEIPRSIVLIIDYSGSQFPYIKTSVEAAKVLVDKLKPKDKMAIVTDDVELLSDFTGDKQVLKEKLDLLKNNAFSRKMGRSQQYSALYAVLNEAFDEEDARPIIIFQTDGDELTALKGGGLSPNSPLGERNFSFDDVITATEKARATIYTVIPGTKFIGLSENEALEKARIEYGKRIAAFSALQDAKAQPRTITKDFLDRWAQIFSKTFLRQQLAIASIARFTGGWAEYLETPEQAGDVYTRILNGMNNRYLIGYYPTNQTRDGKRRKIEIKVRNYPEYIIWGRKTYFAPQPENLNK